MNMYGLIRCHFYRWLILRHVNQRPVSFASVRQSPWSFWSIALCWMFLAFFRFSPMPNKPIAWDTLGYYLPLASTFVHHDPFLTDKSWLVQLNEREQLTGTLYQITASPKGEDMYFFFFGWSYCYAPFFAVGHALADWLGYPADGFSLPYTMALMIGGLIYLAVGLWYWRKILLLYFDDRVVALTLFIIVLGTNFVNHTSIDNLSTVNVLTMLMALMIWNTIRWYSDGSGKHLVGILGIWIVMTLIKPSETLVCLIPLLWQVRLREPRTWFGAFQRAFAQPKALLIGCLVAVILLLPQLGYWYAMTGRIFFDSYQNPGVGLDWTSPHIVDVLFSFRKGWMVYTPLMALAIIGWIYYYREHQRMATVLGVCFLVFFYVVASWSEWWYGGGFSQRTLIPSYVILSLGLAALITHFQHFRMVSRAVLAAVLVLGLMLNQFQWWQFKMGILDPYRTTSAYYKAVWMKTEAPPGADALKLVHRNFTADLQFDSSRYTQIDLSWVVSNQYDTAWQSSEWSKEKTFSMDAVTNKDHLWLESEVEMECQCTPDEAPLLVYFVKHKGVYGYRATALEPTDSMGIYSGKFLYMTPEMRNYEDVIGTHIWNRKGIRFRLKKWNIRAYQPDSPWSER